MLYQRSFLLANAAMVAAVLLFFGTTWSQPFGSPIEGSLDKLEKSNQSKLFYHDGVWWLTARAADQVWHLWKYQNKTWTKDIQLDTASKSRPDCYIDSLNNRLYVVFSHTSDSRFYLINYEGGTWTIVPGYPVEIEDFSHSDDNVVSFCVAKNGTIWLFRVYEGKLQAVYSEDDGLTWSDMLILKPDLNVLEGVTDAVAFTEDGENYVGVVYAENTTSFKTSLYGFFLHKDSDPATSWNNETAAMGQFPGAMADNHVSAISDSDGTVYIVVKTSGGSINVAENGLYIRKNSRWRQVTVNNKAAWTRTALALDHTNNELFVFGTLESSPEIGLYKKAPIGLEDSLLNAPEQPVFQNGEDDFTNISLALNPVDKSSGLMVVAENKGEDRLWSNFIEITKTTSFVDVSNWPSPSQFALSEVYPNPLKQQELLTGARFSAELFLPGAQPSKVFVYNMLGQRVATLTESVRMSAGTTRIGWDGRDANDRLVPPGVYFLQVQSQRFSDTRKILILR